MSDSLSPSPVAIIMGKSGVGKTTYYNALCETNHEATYSSKSLTRQLFRSGVTHGGNHFTVIDTPGTDSKDEVFKHSFLLKEALTCDPVNAIFVLVAFNPRCDSALDEFDETISYLKEKYRSMVVVVISKFDTAPETHVNSIKQDYAKQFEDEGFPRIMFLSEQRNITNVAAEMLGFMRTPKIQMEYEQDEFLKYFRVADESRAQKKEVKKLQGDVDQLLDGFKSVIGSLGSTEDKDDIITSAIVQSRYELDQIYNGFIAKYGDKMIDMDCYAASITLQKIVEGAHREFTDYANNYLTYNPNDANDWKNCVRKCPHCGLVWVKVSGCDGSTTCGNRDSSRDVSGRPWSLYSFIQQGSGWAWKKNDAKESVASIQVAGSGSAKQGKGCEKTVVWKEMPRLSQKELTTLLEVKGIENLIKTMQNKPDFDKAFKSYSKDIDVSFTK